MVMAPLDEVSSWREEEGYLPPTDTVYRNAISITLKHNEATCSCATMLCTITLRKQAGYGNTCFELEYLHCMKYGYTSLVVNKVLILHMT